MRMCVKKASVPLVHAVFLLYVFHAYMHKTYILKNGICACTSGFPDDEYMMFKTRRRHQELN